MPSTTCERYAGKTLRYICCEPGTAFAGKLTALEVVPAASEPESATGTAWPSGTTSTVRATASERVAPVPFTVSVWRPTFSTRTGKRTPVTWPGPSAMSCHDRPGA